MKFLEQYGLTDELLNELSFRSNLKLNLKKTLKHFDKIKVFDEIEEIYFWYQQFE